MLDPGSSSLVADLPPGAAGHFRLSIYAVLARMLDRLQIDSGTSDTETLAQFPFLHSYQIALRAYQPPELEPARAAAWWDTQRAALERATPGRLPMRALADEAGLGQDAVRLLLAAGLIEEDIRFGALFAALQAPLLARRPCLGVLGWLLGPGDAPGDSWPACHALLDNSFLLVENRDDPRAEWVVRVPPPIWDAIRSAPMERPAAGMTWQRAHTFPSLDALIVPDTLSQAIAHLPAMLASRQAEALVLRGMAGSGRRTILGAVAGALERDSLLCETITPGDTTWRMLGPLATLMGAMPILRCDPAPGETLDLPALPGYRGPVGITLGRSGGLRGPLVGRALSLTLPPTDATARRRFWQAATPPVAPAALDEVTNRFLLQGGHIHQVAALAGAYAALAGRATVCGDDVQQATRALNRQALETLATPLEASQGWGDVIVSLMTSNELQALERRCRQREALRDETGPILKRSLNRGVRALFSGPSGTGKTLAARALAGALGMDIYRVDLAAIVNKYIGETERNLNQVLSRAEELDVLLLLDEGDALMTRRTDVRNANDRYANLETNYLLQRLESYEGVVVITTNAGQRIDSAFVRRLDVIIDFMPPEALERWLIWQSHLPVLNQVSPAFLEQVAHRCILTGGQIRNAALHATLLASGRGGQLDNAALELALQREFRKAGAAYPMRAQPVAPSQIDQLRRFASELE
jgi:hypothetical protein